MSKPGCYGRFTLISSTCVSCDYGNLCDEEHSVKNNLKNKGNYVERAYPVIDWPRKLRAEEKQRQRIEMEKYAPHLEV